MPREFIEDMQGKVARIVPANSCTDPNCALCKLDCWEPDEDDDDVQPA